MDATAIRSHRHVTIKYYADGTYDIYLYVLDLGTRRLIPDKLEEGWSTGCTPEDFVHRLQGAVDILRRRVEASKA